MTKVTDCPKCYGTGTYLFSADFEKVCDCELFYWPLLGPIPPGTLVPASEHEQDLLIENDWVAWVDRGIVDDVRLLWKNNIPTMYSCEGGEGSSRYIYLHGADTDHNAAFELLGGTGSWVVRLEMPDHSAYRVWANDGWTLRGEWPLDEETETG
jgi:hypothetical protein